MTPKTRIKKLEQKARAQEPVTITVQWADETGETQEADETINLTWGDDGEDTITIHVRAKEPPRRE